MFHQITNRCETEENKIGLEHEEQRTGATTRKKMVEIKTEEEMEGGGNRPWLKLCYIWN